MQEAVEYEKIIARFQHVPTIIRNGQIMDAPAELMNSPTTIN